MSPVGWFSITRAWSSLRRSRFSTFMKEEFFFANTHFLFSAKEQILFCAIFLGVILFLRTRTIFFFCAKEQFHLCAKEKNAQMRNKPFLQYISPLLPASALRLVCATAPRWVAGPGSSWWASSACGRRRRGRPRSGPKGEQSQGGRTYKYRGNLLLWSFYKNSLDVCKHETSHLL